MFFHIFSKVYVFLAPTFLHIYAYMYSKHVLWFSPYVENPFADKGARRIFLQGVQTPIPSTSP